MAAYSMDERSLDERSIDARCDSCDGALIWRETTTRSTPVGKRDFDLRCTKCQRLALRRRVGRRYGVIGQDEPDARSSVPNELVSSWGSPEYVRGWSEDDVAPRDGCTDRCYVLRYVNPQGPYDVMQAVRICDATEHERRARVAAFDEIAEPFYDYAGLTFDRRTGETTVDSEPVRLSSSEQRVLSLLTARPGWIISSVEIAALSTSVRSGREGKAYSDHAATMIVVRLRAKLDASNPTRFIQTRRDLGFILAGRRS